MRKIMIFQKTILQLALLFGVLIFTNSCNPSIATLIEKGKTTKAIDQIEKGSDPNEYDKKLKRTPLISAIKLNDVHLVKILLDNGADPNNQTPISYALNKRNIEIVELLIKKGADINASYTYDTYKELLNYTSSDQWSTKNKSIKGTPLIEALHLNLTDNFILFLIENGANIDVMDSFDRTPLVFAVKNNRTEIVSNLVNLGANKNINYKYISKTMTNAFGWDIAVEYSSIALMDAAKSTGNLEIIKLLSK